MKPYEYVKPTTWSTAITEQGGTIQFNTVVVNSSRTRF